MSRIIKILKAPAATEGSLLRPLALTLGYELFTLRDGVPMELDPDYGAEFAQDYNIRVARMAWDISQLLGKLTGDR